MKRTASSVLLASSLLLSPCASLHAQAAAATTPATPPPAGTHHEAQNPVRIFHLKYVAQQNEANEIVVALRNMIEPADKIYLLSTTNDIAVSASPEQLNLVASLIPELDRPKPAYRITYTLAESENGKRIGIQHFSMVAVPGQRITLKQGDKIPVATGSYSTEKSAQETQFTYLDVGINLDTTLDLFAGGLRLRSKFEQSAVAQERQKIMDVDEPIVRQSVLEGTSVIVPGKPMVLGGIDVSGSTRHIDVEVVADPLS